MPQLTLEIGMDSGAEFDPTRTYRYRLWRTWDPTAGRVAWVMLNPSTADEVELDPTLRRCRGFTACWGYGGFDVVNLFALRSTDPTALVDHQQRTGQSPVGERNDGAILRTCRAADLVIAAWGRWGSLFERGEDVGRMLLRNNLDVHILGRTAEGYPQHPLYLRKNLEPVPIGGRP